MAARADRLAPRSGWKLVGAALLAVVLAAGWMVLTLAAGKAGLGTALTSQSAGQATISQALTRTGITAQGSKVQALFASVEFFERSGQSEFAAEADPAKHLVFVVTENDHIALAPSVPSLLVDGKALSIPMKDRVLSESEHHRTRLIRFPRTDGAGTSYIPVGARKLELAWPGVNPVHAADHTLTQPMNWALPLILPAEGPGVVTPWAFLLLTAGLFAALSPCLIQLTLYYLSALAGASGNGEPASRGRVLTVAGMFVAGISLAYVTGGVLAGLLGRTIQVSDVLGSYGRYVAIASGAIIIWMGYRTMLSSQAPLVCRMPMPLAGRLSRSRMGPVAPFLMGFLMSLGCLQCFGGAIFASLLLYVGSLGSPALGALMLFLFSLGIAVPFLCAALAWERVLKRLEGLQRVMQSVAAVSGVIMMSFGILMVIDRFHWISAMVVQWLPFLRV